MARITTRDWQTMAKHMAERKGFTAHGALHAEGLPWPPFTALLSDHGRLPGDWSRTLQARSDVIDYMVWSYQTPIAWHNSETGWVVPDEHYSQRTTMHQNKIRTALTVNGETYAE